MEGKKGVEFHGQVEDVSEIAGRVIELSQHGYKVTVSRLRDYYNNAGNKIKSSDFIITYW